MKSGVGRREEGPLRGPADASGRKCRLDDSAKPVLIPGGGTLDSQRLAGGREAPPQSLVRGRELRRRAPPRQKAAVLGQD